MNSCCAQYYIIAEDDPIKPKKLVCETSECTNCNCYCGYIQFESLVPYMPKLSNHYTKDEDHIIGEAKLRQQIIEISRLFDAETRVEDGYYSKAHYKVIKLIGNDTKYLSIPDFVKGTLELYNSGGYLINPETYEYRDSHLILNPCSFHSNTCGCSSSCGMYQKKTYDSGWQGCFQAKAKFGKECSDQAVQMAVRDFLIEHNTFSDEKEAKFAGLVPRPFRVPYSWSSLVQKYSEGKRLYTYFGFA